MAINFKSYNTFGADITVPSSANKYLVEWTAGSGQPVSAGFQVLSGDITGNVYPINDSNGVSTWRWQFTSAGGGEVRLHVVSADPA